MGVGVGVGSSSFAIAGASTVNQITISANNEKSEILESIENSEDFSKNSKKINTNMYVSQTHAIPDSSVFLRRDTNVASCKSDTLQVKTAQSLISMSTKNTISTKTVRNQPDSTLVQTTVLHIISTAVKPTHLKNQEPMNFKINYHMYVENK